MVDMDECMVEIYIVSVYLYLCVIHFVICYVIYVRDPA